MPVKEKKVVDLDKLTEALQNLDPDKYPDYTKDWPLEDLRKAIKDGDESNETLVSSAEEHLKQFKNNPL